MLGSVILIVDKMAQVEQNGAVLAGMGDSEQFKKAVLQSLHAIKNGLKDQDVFLCRNN